MIDGILISDGLRIMFGFLSLSSPGEWGKGNVYIIPGARNSLHNIYIYESGLAVHTYNPTLSEVRQGNERAALATETVQGQPELHENLSQKQDK